MAKILRHIKQLEKINLNGALDEIIETLTNSRLRDKAAPFNSAKLIFSIGKILFVGPGFSVLPFDKQLERLCHESIHLKQYATNPVKTFFAMLMKSTRFRLEAEAYESGTFKFRILNGDIRDWKTVGQNVHVLNVIGEIQNTYRFQFPLKFLRDWAIEAIRRQLEICACLERKDAPHVWKILRF